MIIDFCTTAILRPEILNKCYSSFQKNLLDLDLKKCHLFINVDPMGIPKNNGPRRYKIAQEYLKYWKEYFKYTYIYMKKLPTTLAFSNTINIEEDLKSL